MSTSNKYDELIALTDNKRGYFEEELVEAFFELTDKEREEERNRVTFFYGLWLAKEKNYGDPEKISYEVVESYRDNPYEEAELYCYHYRDLKLAFEAIEAASSGGNKLAKRFIEDAPKDYKSGLGVVSAGGGLWVK